MGRDMLSVKLDQLEQRLKRLHTRIYMGQTAGHSQLRQKIDALEQECAQAESALEENLRGSKSAVVSIRFSSFFIRMRINHMQPA